MEHNIKEFLQQFRGVIIRFWFSINVYLGMLMNILFLWLPPQTEKQHKTNGLCGTLLWVSVMEGVGVEQSISAHGKQETERFPEREQGISYSEKTRPYWSTSSNQHPPLPMPVSSNNLLEEWIQVAAESSHVQWDIWRPCVMVPYV